MIRFVRDHDYSRRGYLHGPEDDCPVAEPKRASVQGMESANAGDLRALIDEARKALVLMEGGPKADGARLTEPSPLVAPAPLPNPSHQPRRERR